MSDTSFLTLTIHSSNSLNSSTKDTSNSLTSLNSNPSNTTALSFKITKAHIKESLEELFSIECEGYIESLKDELLDSNIHSSLLNPQKLIDNFAILSIHNPYENKTINFDYNEVKNYKGLITYVNYHGVNEESSMNMNETSSNITTLKYKHFFSFKLQGVLIRLSLNKASRIYTHTNVLEVLKQTLNFYQGKLAKELDFSNIHLSYETKELISQYNESDLAFITRLAHNNGIFFYEDENKIYFCDVYAHQKSKKIKYNPNINNVLNEACITKFYKEQSIKANAWTHSSLNSLTPVNLLSLSSNHSSYEQELNPKNSYNEHHYESASSFTQNIDLKTPLVLKERRTLVLNESLKAKSNIYHLSLADFIELDYNAQEYKEEQNLKDFVLIANEQILIDEAILSNSFNTKDHLELKDLTSSKSYSNTLTLLKRNIIFTPSFKTKPKAPNNTQGIVIGESSNIESQRNTIYTDEYGRVKVRINLYANQEEPDYQNNENLNSNDLEHSNLKDNLNANALAYHHTPFLRVASPLASNHSGLYHTPRVGDEVIVSFLDDDIDKPYVSASLYNASNPALVNLPHNDHQTSLSSKTIGLDEEGRNELTMSNIKDKEQIYLKAQKDYDELIEHNFTQRILNDKDSKVEGFYTERIKKAHTQTIDLAKNVNIGAEYLINVALSKDTLVGLSNTLNVGVDNKLRIAKNSSEYVGENKDIEIASNQNTLIGKDETKNVKGNKKEVVEGSWDIRTYKDININSHSNYSLSTEDNIDLYSKDSLKLSSTKQTTLINNNLLINTKEQALLNADKKIKLSIGDAKIESNGKQIILQVGSSKIVIKKNGISIQGKVDIGE